MNIQEFAALKVGDKVRNDMAHSDGEVVEIDKAGVRVRWAPTAAPRHYSAQSTIWFHWRKVQELTPAAPPAYCPHGDKVLCNDPIRCKHGTDDAQCLGGDYDAIIKGL